MTVELQSFIAAGRPPRARADEGHERRRDAARQPGESAGRMYVVSGHYDSRCTDVHELDLRRAGRRRRRLGRRGRARDGARDGHARSSTPRSCSWRSPARSRACYGSTYSPSRPRQQGARHRRHVHQRHRRQLARPTNGVRDRQHVRLFAEGPPGERDRRRGDDPAHHGRRERLAAAPARALSSKDVPTATPTGMSVRIIYRRDRFLRGGDHLPFLERRYPAARFTEANEDYRHQHQDVRVENGVQFGDLAQFLDFGYVARVANVNAATLAGARRARPPRPRTSRSRRRSSRTTPSSTGPPNTEPDLAGYEIVYRDTIEPYWTPRDRRRQRHELHRQGDHEGQLPLRRARRRHRRQPQPRQLPPPRDLIRLRDVGVEGAR